MNAPESTVVSGERKAVAALIKQFETSGVRTQSLAVSHAFHSPLMKPIRQEFAKIAETIPANSTKIPWISTLSGTVVNENVHAQYWCEHALHPVRFADGMDRVASLNTTDFIEVGPGSTLLTLVVLPVLYGWFESGRAAPDADDEERHASSTPFPASSAGVGYIR